MHTWRKSPHAAAWVLACSWQLPAADDTMAQARALEAVSYDLALAIIELQREHGTSGAVLLARDELHQLDEHLTWMEHHGHRTSKQQVWAELEQASSNASHIRGILAIA